MATNPPLTPTEKVKVRYHLGYPNVTAVGSYQLGVPIPIQTMFLVESSMDRIIDEALPVVRDLIATLDEIECRMRKGFSHRAAKRIGDIEINEKEIHDLEAEHTRFASRLAEMLGVPLYAFSSKFKGRVGNLPVRG